MVFFSLSFFPKKFVILFPTFLNLIIFLSPFPKNQVCEDNKIWWINEILTPNFEGLGTSMEPRFTQKFSILSKKQNYSLPQKLCFWG